VRLATLGRPPGPLLRAVKAEAETLRVAHLSMAADQPSRGHLEFVSCLAAAHRVLSRETALEGKALFDFLDRATRRGFDTRGTRISIRLLLFACRNHPGRLRSVLGWVMSLYGVTFRWTLEETSPGGGFALDIGRCFYFDFLSRLDLAELTPVLCRIDSLWFDAIDPARHGFRFDKGGYTTQGYGAARCRFPILADQGAEVARDGEP
jgi:hypothetical protein